MKEDKIISYSLFDSIKTYNHRTWDLFNNSDRYWYNIPALVILNSILYPNFIMKFHISKNITKNPLYNLFEKMKNVFNVEIEVFDYEYQNTEPTTWRYKPLLNRECDILICRDVDSIPTLDEYLSTEYFINNGKYKLSTIRSHKNHKIPKTIILAGLCAFRPKELKHNITFEEFIEKIKGSSWGIDQDFLIEMFTKDNDFTKKYFLDSKLNSNKHSISPPLIHCDSFDERYYEEMVINVVSEEIREIMNDFTEWAGEPTDIRGDKLKRLLEIYDVNSKKMLSILNSDNLLKKFYL